jgi:hypothetical protein
MDDQSLEILRQMFEIKEFLEQNQSTSGGLPMSIGNVLQQSIAGKQISGELFALTLICKHIIDNNRNVGFRGYLCTNCFSYWADLVCNNKEEGMKSLLLEKASNHKCDPKKCQEINTLNCQDVENKKEQACKGLGDLVTSMISGIVLFGQKTIYLNIEELNCAPPQLSWIKEEDCINLGDIKEMKDSYWASRAIKEGKGEDKKGVVMDGSELIDFVKTTRANFGTFRVQMEDDGSTRYFLMYFSIV